MTISFWYGGHHAALALLRSIAVNANDAAALPAWADQFEPSTLPNKPTAYAGPFNAIPTNGGYYLRPTRTVDTARRLPFVEVELESQDKEFGSDGLSDRYMVRLTVRATIGASTSSAVIGQSIVDSQAIALCQLATIVGCDYLRATALSLNADAFGICWSEVERPPSIDLTSPQPPTATGTTAAIASASVVVYQRQFAPAGIGQTSTNP